MTTTTHNDHSRHARSDSHPSSGFRKDSNHGSRNTGFHRKAGTSALPRINIMTALLAGLFAVMAFLSQPAFAQLTFDETQFFKAPLGLEWGMSQRNVPFSGGPGHCRGRGGILECVVENVSHGISEFRTYVFIYGPRPTRPLIGVRAISEPVISDPKGKHIDFLLEKYKRIIAQRYGDPNRPTKRQLTLKMESYQDCMERDDCKDLQNWYMDPASASHSRCVYKDECAEIVYEWSKLEGWMFLETGRSVEGDARWIVASFYSPDYSTIYSREMVRSFILDLIAIQGHTKRSN